MRLKGAGDWGYATFSTGLKPDATAVHGRKIIKKFRRSGFVKRPFPAARLVAIEERGSIQLVDEKTVTTREALAQCRDFVSEIDGLLVDIELLEHEGHDSAQLREETRGRRDF